MNQLHESGGVWTCRPPCACTGDGFTDSTVFVGFTIVSIVDAFCGVRIGTSFLNVKEFLNMF